MKLSPAQQQVVRRILVLTAVLTGTALLIGIAVDWGQGLPGGAEILTCMCGAPIAFGVALLLHRKDLGAAILCSVVGTVIACAMVGVIAGPEPLLMAGAVVVVAFLTWLTLPSRPANQDPASCPKCGYCVRGLTSHVCPECGNELFGELPWKRGGEGE